MMGLAGVTAIDESVAAVTVSVVEPTTAPLVALIVEVPCLHRCGQAAALIVASLACPKPTSRCPSGSASSCR